MTLTEAKDKIAEKHGYSSWMAFVSNEIHHYPTTTFWGFIEEAAELYVRSKWDEACEAQQQICSNLLNDWEFGGRSNVHHFKDASKPEFK